MSKEIVEVIVDGGKASAGAAMGKAFGPLKMDIQTIIKEINEKTKEFGGMKVPVKVIVETKDKSFEVEVGSPSVSELIKSELVLQKGSGDHINNKVGILSIEQVIKISKMKRDSMLANNLKSAVKMVLGSCQSLGVLVEGKDAKLTSQDVSRGVYDKEINEEKTTTDSEKTSRLKEQFKQVLLQQEIKAKQKEAAAQAAAAAAPEVAPKEAEKKEEVKPEAKKEAPKKDAKKK